MKPANLLRILRRLATRRGWSFAVTEGGRHTKVWLNGRFTTLPRHPVDLKTGLFRGILKDLNLTEADLEE
jgi:hypothetical protein